MIPTNYSIEETLRGNLLNFTDEQMKFIEKINLEGKAQEVKELIDTLKSELQNIAILAEDAEVTMSMIKTELGLKD